MEKLKNDINEQRRNEHEHLQAADHSKLVLNSIKSTIIDLILKLQEIDETIDPMNLGGLKFELMKNPFIDLSCDSISNDMLLQVSRLHRRNDIHSHRRTEMRFRVERVYRACKRLLESVFFSMNCDNPAANPVESSRNI